MPFVLRSLLFLGSMLSCVPAWSAHAYAQFGDIRYPSGFSHFAYVNPDAPKGGPAAPATPTRSVAVSNRFGASSQPTKC